MGQCYLVSPTALYTSARLQDRGLRLFTLYTVVYRARHDCRSDYSNSRPTRPPAYPLNRRRLAISARCYRAHQHPRWLPRPPARELKAVPILNLAGLLETLQWLRSAALDRHRLSVIDGAMCAHANLRFVLWATQAASNAPCENFT